MLGTSLLHSAVAVWALLSPARAIPFGDYVRADTLVDHNTTTPIAPIDLHPDLLKRQAVGTVDLRILPLGASIVWGYLSSDNNGYSINLKSPLVSNN